MPGDWAEGEDDAGGRRPRVQLQLHHLQHQSPQVSPGVGSDQLSVGFFCLHTGDITR